MEKERTRWWKTRNGLLEGSRVCGAYLSEDLQRTAGSHPSAGACGAFSFLFLELGHQTRHQQAHDALSC
jgi:hypothetical protein